MRFAGSASWRFAEGIEQAPLIALFVRDTLSLEVSAEASPPRLDGELPDHSTLLDSQWRAAAGDAWTGWWQAVVAQDVRGHQGPPAGVDQRVWLRQLDAEHRAVFDPPEFASLADRPALAETVRVTFNAALRWADAERRALLIPPQGRPGQFDYEVVRAAAEQTAHRHQISPDAVRPAPWCCRSRESGGPDSDPVRCSAPCTPPAIQAPLAASSLKHSSPASPTDPPAPIEDR